MSKQQSYQRHYNVLENIIFIDNFSSNQRYQQKYGMKPQKLRSSDLQRLTNLGRAGTISLIIQVDIVNQEIQALVPGLDKLQVLVLKRFIILGW